MSNFKDWTRDKLKKRFGLKRVYDHQALAEWTAQSKTIDIDAHTKPRLWTYCAT